MRARRSQKPIVPRRETAGTRGRRSPSCSPRTPGLRTIATSASGRDGPPCEGVGTILSGPKVRVPAETAPPARAYFLFHGPLSEIGEWGVPRIEPGEPYGYEPAFIWPADHAWCVANDVDPHWAGIGGDRRLIDHLLEDPRLDAIEADPAADPPAYR